MITDPDILLAIEGFLDDMSTVAIGSEFNDATPGVVSVKREKPNINMQTSCKR